MNDNFDLKKFLVENKATTNSNMNEEYSIDSLHNDYGPTNNPSPQPTSGVEYLIYIILGDQKWNGQDIRWNGTIKKEWIQKALAMEKGDLEKGSKSQTTKSKTSKYKQPSTGVLHNDYGPTNYPIKNDGWN